MAQGIVGCHLVSVLCLVVQLGVPLDVADNVPSPEEDAQRPDGVRLLEEDVDVSEGITDFEGLSPTHTYTISAIIKGSFFTKTKATILLPRFNRCGEKGLGLCHSFELPALALFRFREFPLQNDCLLSEQGTLEDEIRDLPNWRSPSSASFHRDPKVSANISRAVFFAWLISAAGDWVLVAWPILLIISRLD